MLLCCRFLLLYAGLHRFVVTLIVFIVVLSLFGAFLHPYVDPLTLPRRLRIVSTRHETGVYRADNAPRVQRKEMHFFTEG